MVDEVRKHREKPLGRTNRVEENFLTGPLVRALFGDKNAMVNVPVTPQGVPTNLNMSPSEYQGHYGMAHPSIEAGATGGLLATGAPELMARSLLAPVAQGVKAAAKAAPITTGTVAGAMANTALPSNTGKTPWEAMMEQWEGRRRELRGKIGEEDKIIKQQKERLAMTPEEQARIERMKNELLPLEQRMEGYKNRKITSPTVENTAGKITALKNAIAEAENRGGKLDILNKEISAIVNPAEERRKGYEQGLSDIDKEIMKSQTPIRQQTYPWSLGTFPVAWGLAGMTGNKIGKIFRGGQEAKLDKMNDLINRTEQHIAQTSSKTGGALKSQFNSPEGMGLSQELQAMSGTPRWKGWNPLGAAGTGAVVGGAEGLMAPGAFNAVDAQMAPGGSPLSEASGWNAITSPSWWRSVAPEVGMGALIGGITSGVRSGYGGGKWGAVDLPQDRINALNFAAKGAQMPRLNAPTVSKTAPKGKAKGKAPPAPPASGGPSPLNDLPDL